MFFLKQTFHLKIEIFAGFLFSIAFPQGDNYI